MAGHELGIRVAEGHSDHAWLHALNGDDVQVIVTSCLPDGSPGLEPLSHLTGLRQLIVGGRSEVSDASLAPLEKLASLHHLLVVT